MAVHRSPVHRSSVVVAGCLIAVLGLIATSCGSSSSPAASTTTASSEQAPEAAPAPTPTTDVPATAVPPTAVPPTQVPPTPTEVPPTPEPTTVPPTEVPEPTAAPATADLESASVEVLDEGAEPRMVLQRDTSNACPEVVRIESTIGFEQNVGGVDIPPQPALSQVIELRVTSEQVPEGFAVTSEFIRARAGDDTDPSIAGLVNSELSRLDGLRTVELTDQTGTRLGEASIEDAELIDDATLTLMENLLDTSTTLFPATPIGVGAIFSITNQLDVQGVTIAVTSTFDIVAINNSLVTLNVVTEQSVAAGSRLEATPGLFVEVLEWGGRGTGRVVVDLLAMNPVEATATETAIQVLDAGPGGGGVINQTITTTTMLTSVLEGSCPPRPGRSAAG